jgi:hypothetical protein
MIGEAFAYVQKLANILMVKIVISACMIFYLSNHLSEGGFLLPQGTNEILLL